MKGVLITNRLQNISRLFILDKRFAVLKGGFYKYNKKIVGVGLRRLNYLMSRTGIARGALLSQLPLYKISLLSEYGRKAFVYERELQALVKQNIFNKIKNGSYTGIRLKQGLPSRGQRTKSNARTSKRLRRT